MSIWDILFEERHLSIYIIRLSMRKFNFGIEFLDKYLDNVDKIIYRDHFGYTPIQDKNNK